MPHEILAEILGWSVERPGWQRDALRRLFTKGTLTSADLDDLTDLCKAARGLSAPRRSADVLAEAHLAVSGRAGTTPISLVSVTHHRGVNALASEQTITFGPNLTIVYGQNAAGKSGYTRILKRACRSRSTEEVLGNVLSGDKPFKAQATIRFREGTKEDSFEWAPDVAPSGSLAAISAFDAHCAPVYLSDKTDVAFRPFSLDIFDKLAGGCAAIRERLDAELEKLKSAAVTFPEVPAGTQTKALLDGLTSLTRPEDVQALATLSTGDERRLQELRDRERDLRASDPKRRAGELTLKAQRIEGVAAHVAKLAAECGESALRGLRAAVDALAAAREALAVLRKTALTSDLLKGTGEVVWRQMWEAAAAFSSVAYPATPFPVLSRGARCPLCQQDLGTDAKTRLGHFQEFVLSSAQADVRKAEDTLNTRLKAVTSLVIEREGLALAITELKADDPWLAQQSSDCLRDATRFREEVKKAIEAGTPLPLHGLSGAPDKELYAAAKTLRERATALAQHAAGMKPEDRAELADLEGRLVLKANIHIVLSVIERKKRLAVYTECLKDTETQAVTRKSTELTKRLVTDQLRTEFQAELARLNFTDLAVEIRAAGGAKGALFHHLVFTNAPGVPVAAVLSEGESRALSLAAFLTELSTAASRSAILFDDPVSSLDHIWRERIAARLVDEAKSRQVIVFTHDLLFLRLLIDEAERHAVPYQHQYVHQDGHQTGIASSDLPWVAMGTKQRIGVLRNRWQAADKLSRKATQEEYEKEARDIYGLLRETWEQAVGEILLNDVVGRYRPAVETQKVRDLHDITKEDCTAVDDAVTECSRWLRGHDQPPADGTPFPSAQDLKKRIDNLDDWVQRIRKRR